MQCNSSFRLLLSSKSLLLGWYGDVFWFMTLSHRLYLMRAYRRCAVTSIIRWYNVLDVQCTGKCNTQIRNPVLYDASNMVTYICNKPPTQRWDIPGKLMWRCAVKCMIRLYNALDVMQTILFVMRVKVDHFSTRFTTTVVSTCRYSN